MKVSHAHVYMDQLDGFLITFSKIVCVVRLYNYNKHYFTKKSEKNILTYIAQSINHVLHVIKIRFCRVWHDTCFNKTFSILSLNCTVKHKNENQTKRLMTYMITPLEKT